MAYGYTLEAEYKDGYVHSEAELNDISPFNSSKNVFNDILEQRPAGEHGHMVRWSMVPDQSGQRFDIDWTLFPPDAKPIYFRKMEMQVTGGNAAEPYATAHFFGYEFWETNGKKTKVIIKVDPYTGAYEVVEEK